MKTKNKSHRCDLGLDALPEAPGVILVLGGQRVPHPDHVVADAQRQTPGAHRGEGQGIDKPTQGGQSPAAVQRGKVPAFNLGKKRPEVFTNVQLFLAESVRCDTFQILRSQLW